MNNKFYRILTTIFFTLAALIVLTTLLLVYKPLKDIFLKKQIVEETTEELTEETTIQEQTIQEQTEETKEKTEETAEEKTTEEENEGVMPNAYPLFEHQGIVLDIDYEKYIITIENAKTGEIKELDCYRIIEKCGGDAGCLDVSYHFLSPVWDSSEGFYRLLEDANFKDIKVGYYVAIYTTKDAGEKAIKFWQDDNLITVIYFSEERWW